MARRKRASPLASASEDEARLLELQAREKELPPFFNLAFSHDPYMRAEEARGARLLLEYERVENQLIAEGIDSTITFFGSAQIQPGQRLQDAALEASAEAGFYELTRDIAAAITERYVRPSGAHGRWSSVIATGGGPGLMAAANQGAQEAGGPSIGFCKTLPSEAKPNPYISSQLCFLFHYFAIRKLHLALRARAFICAPGGFGTLDEIFEILTLRKTGGMHAVPTVFIGEAFWREAVNFDLFVREGLAPDPSEVDAVFVDSVGAAMDMLEARLAA